MNLKLLEREVTELNLRFLHIYLRMPDHGELHTCLHLNLDLRFLRVVRDLSLNEIEFLANGYTALLKPAITDMELQVASKMTDKNPKAMFLLGRKM